MLMRNLSSVAYHLESPQHLSDGEESDDFGGGDANDCPLLCVKVSETGNAAVWIS